MQRITDWSIPGIYGSCILGNHSVLNENGYLIIQNEDVCTPLRIQGNVVIAGTKKEKNLQLMVRNGKLYATGLREIYRVPPTDYNHNWARCAQMFPTHLVAQAI